MSADKMDLDQSRQYLCDFMGKHFTDATFMDYICTRLAGDFAWQMANSMSAEIARLTQELAEAKAAPVQAQGDLTATECPNCHGSGEQFGSFACEECDGQGCILVSKADMEVQAQGVLTDDRYSTGVKPWSFRIPANQPLSIINDAMQAELNDLRALLAAQAPPAFNLIEAITSLEMLFPDGCNEPGALVRFSDVRKIAFAAQAPAPARELTDADIVRILHKRAIDTHPSKYGFPELQVSGTNVPQVRNIVIDCIAHLTGNAGAPVAQAPASDALDAERYRWLRDSPDSGRALHALLDGVPNTIGKRNKFDAAIDEAIAALKEQS